jgi:TatA/E family protein of Tat protein translocase
MFGSVGPTELILIFIIALLVFGPKKLPEIGKSVGKALREFKKASEDIKTRIEEEIQASEIKDVHKDLRDGMNSLRDGIQGIADASGVTDLKNELKGIAVPTAAPAVPPKTENTAKDEAHHETGEGQKVSG